MIFQGGRGPIPSPPIPPSGSTHGRDNSMMVKIMMMMVKTMMMIMMVKINGDANDGEDHDDVNDGEVHDDVNDG